VYEIIGRKYFEGRTEHLTDLVPEDDIANGKVEDGKQENERSNDTVGHGNHEDEDVLRDQRLILK